MTMASPLKAALTSSSMKWAVGGWSLFIAENLVLSENRTYIIGQLGDDGYHYLYGFFSTAAVGSILYGYRYKVRGAGPFAWPIGGAAPPVAKAASFAVLSLALGMASQTFPKLQIPVHMVSDSVESHQSAATVGPAVPAEKLEVPRQWKVRCPFDFTDSKSQTGTDKSNPTRNPDGTIQLHGLDRVTRHPGLWSFGLLGVGNALLVNSIPTRVWMSMPIMVALIGGGHTDSRHRRGIGGALCEEMDAVTSNVPFLAMITGRQEDGSIVRAFSEFSKEFKWLNAGVAAAAAAGWVASRGRGSSRLTASALVR